MDPTWVVWGLCIAAVLALLLNLKKKLPKFVFIFFAVAIVVGVSWVALGVKNPGLSSNFSNNASSEKPPLVYFGIANNVAVPAGGETRVALPVLVSGARKFDSVRFLFKAKDADFTEQAFMEKVDFSLLFADGTLIPASGIVFSESEKSETAAFPEEFVLKVFFKTPKDAVPGDIRCLIKNGLSTALTAEEISVTSLPKNSMREDG